MTHVRWTFFIAVFLVTSAGCAGASRTPYAVLGADTIPASPRPVRLTVAVTETAATADDVCRDGCCEGGGSPQTPPTDEFVGGAADITESGEALFDGNAPRSPLPFGT